jgi:hypothetical protein
MGNQRVTQLKNDQSHSQADEILKEIVTWPNNQNLMKERQEIEDQILKCENDLNNEIEMKLMDDKKMARSNA